MKFQELPFPKKIKIRLLKGESKTERGEKQSILCSGVELDGVQDGRLR